MIKEKSIPRFLFCVSLFLLIAVPGVLVAKSGELKSEDITEFYVSPGQESTLHFSFEGTNQPLACLVADYQGHKVSEGEMPIDAQKKGVLKVRLDRGYYEISFAQCPQRFGIISLEPADRKDPFFCLDTSLSWLELRPAMRESLINIMNRSGIAMSRERLNVPDVNPADGKWNWVGGNRDYERLRQDYSEAKLPILDLLNGSPRRFMGGGHNYPQNIVGYSETVGTIGEHWQSVWGGVEVMNEPDLGLESGEQYAPVIKAASYGLASKNRIVPVVGGVAGTIPPSGWFDTLAANGAVFDIDAFSFHSYNPPIAAEKFVQRCRDWLKAAGRPNLPLWHTECGWKWTTGPMRPGLEEDAEGAMSISASAVEDFACGVARFFPFILPPYGEGNKQFGMIGNELSPTRHLAAYLATARMLSGKSYLGDLAGLDKSVRLSRVFGDEKSDDVAVFLYTGNSGKETSLDFPATVTGVVGIDGREISFKGRTVEILDGMVFVRTTRSALGDMLKTDTSAAKLYALGQNPTSAKRLASPMAIQFLSDFTPARGSVIQYTVSQETARDLPVTVRFNNLSDLPIQVEPSLQARGIAPMVQAARTIPAQSSSDVTWHFDATHSLDLESTRFLTATAKIDKGNQPSALAIPLVMEGNLEEHLARHSKSRAVLLTNLTSWRENSEAGIRTQFSVKDGIFQMNVIGHGWAYPKLAMNVFPQLPQDKGFLVRARIQAKAVNIALMVNNNQPDGFWDRDIFIADGQWHVVYIPFDEMNPGPGGNNQNVQRNPVAWKILSIGANFAAETNMMEISHVYIVGGDSHE